MAEADENKKINASSLKLVCQLCDNIFEEAIPIACVHLMFCGKCFEKNGLLDDLGHGLVCTRCPGNSASRVSGQNDNKSMHYKSQIAVWVFPFTVPLVFDQTDTLQSDPLFLIHFPHRGIFRRQVLCLDF